MRHTYHTDEQNDNPTTTVIDAFPEASVVPAVIAFLSGPTIFTSALETGPFSLFTVTVIVTPSLTGSLIVIGDSIFDTDAVTLKEASTIDVKT